MENITFVATSHNEKSFESPLTDSLLAQKNPNWKLIVFNNGPNLSIDPVVYKDHRIQYTESNIDSGMWGCKNRQVAIDRLVNTTYVINTSIQDYYLPNAVQEISNAIAAGGDLICWQAINHLFRYSVINGELAWGHIDWGQWCVKTDYIRSTGIVAPENFSGDWHTLNAILQKGLIKTHMKIDKILTIHN